MDELLAVLKEFKGGEILLSYNESGHGWEITAAAGRFSKTMFLVDSSRLDKGECATILSMKVARQVKEAVNLDRNARRADPS